MAPVRLVARTLSPAHYRTRLLTAFFLGLGAGFLGVPVYRPALPERLPVEAFAVAVGSVAGLSPAYRFWRGGVAGLAVLLYVMCYSAVTACGWAAVSCSTFAFLAQRGPVLTGLATVASRGLAVESAAL